VSTEQVREHEEQEVEDRVAVRAHVVHAAILKQGEDELERTTSALAWSALAAGLSMSLSFLAEAVLRAHLPDVPWRPLISKLGYSVGFIVVVLGRQQLYTENTLTAVIPLLQKKDGATFVKVLRLWFLVLIANLVGAHIAAWVYGNTPALSEQVRNAMHDIASEAMRVDFTAALVRGIFAGWLIALVVWLRAAVDYAEVLVIVVPTYLVAISSFTHIIAGSVECLYLVMMGQLGWLTFAATYMVPTFVGNSIGGVVMVSLLNHAQVVSDEKS